MIDVLTLNYNDASTTIQFVESIKSYSCIGHVLVVDNKSTDDSLTRLKTIESEKVLVIASEKNGGYGAGNNLGIRYLKEHFDSKYVLLSNPDVIVDEITLNRLEQFLVSNSNYTLVAPAMLNPDGSRARNTAFRIPSCWEYVLSLNVFTSKFLKTFCYTDFADEAQSKKNVGAVSGSMFMMNVDDMLQYGMYDESMFLYCEEIVLGLKLREKEKQIALLTDCTFIHNHSVSIDKTFGKSLAKHRIFLKSKLYVIRKYFKANIFIQGVAWFLSKISLLEVKIVHIIRRFK